jgi:outer membrane biosynthesis protein TonB
MAAQHNSIYSRQGICFLIISLLLHCLITLILFLDYSYKPFGNIKPPLLLNYPRLQQPVMWDEPVKLPLPQGPLRINHPNIKQPKKQTLHKQQSPPKKNHVKIQDQKVSLPTIKLPPVTQEPISQATQSPLTEPVATIKTELTPITKDTHIDHVTSTVPNPGYEPDAEQKIARAQYARHNFFKTTKKFINKIIDEECIPAAQADQTAQDTVSTMEVGIYRRKVDQAWFASWDANCSDKLLKKEFSLLFARPHNALVEYTVDQKGKLVDAKILESTGHLQLDTLIIKSLALAHFPPIPEHFKEKTQTRIIPIKTDHLMGDEEHLSLGYADQIA